MNEDKKQKNELFNEVFGYPVDDVSEEALSCRRKGLCPFTGGPCNKSTYQDDNGNRIPMGVCSFLHHGDKVAITCPHRLKEDNLIFNAVAEFSFPGSKQDEIILIPEVRLKTRHGLAGNVDYILALLKNGRITDFAGIELQAVYFSGDSMRALYKNYIKRHDKGTRFSPEQTGKQNPDYRSSSKKRLLPQLIEKGPIFSAWKKRFAVAIHEDFLEDLERNIHFMKVSKSEANFAWIVLGYSPRNKRGGLSLEIRKMVYTTFESVMRAFVPSAADIPEVGKFMEELQVNIDFMRLNST